MCPLPDFNGKDENAAGKQLIPMDLSESSWVDLRQRR